MSKSVHKKIKDEYQVIEEVGSGGMATVYKAIQKSLDRPVAIKELNKSFHADPTLVQRFEREARLAASFQHENIVHIYDYGKAPEFCIVMEYVDGVTLSQVISKNGPLPTDVGVMIALQVSDALEYAHSRGMIHRDIKPGNIMIKRNGEVKLMDFGIARTRGQEALTLPGMLIGTPSYMSPEQAIGDPLDIRSDIFSLGIVLYEIFTGVKPFQDEETASIAAKIVKGRYRSPRRINGDLPRSLQRIIRKCLKTKPQKRFDSMQTLGKGLGKRIKGMDKSASLKRISDYLVASELIEPPTAAETVAVYQAPGMGTFTKVLSASAVAFLLIVAGIAYYSWTKARDARLLQANPSMTAPSSSGLTTRPTYTLLPVTPPAPDSSIVSTTSERT